ncbi:DUF4860 domain-containing protein [Agathobacter sp.]
MFKIRTGSRRIDSIFVMILFFLFALTAFVLVMIGVKQYQATADSMNYNYEVRTATSYLREKIRQNDSHAAISIDNIEGTNVLSLKSEINGIVYYTYIYYYDGYLRELYVQDGSSYSLSSGQQIIELSGFELSEATDRLITVTITDTWGGTTDMYLSVNSI